MATWLRRLFGGKSKPARSTERRRGFRPQLETLEDRLLLSATPALTLTGPTFPSGLVLTVTNSLDSGPGSLRAAINTINNDTLIPRTSPDQIVFDNDGEVLLANPLPFLTRGDVIIDGTNQGGNETLQNVGNFSDDCLDITGGNTTVENLFVTAFGNGILLSQWGHDTVADNNLSANLVGLAVGSNDNTVRGNFIGPLPGTLHIGTLAQPNNTGVILSGKDNLVLGNTISGNSESGIQVFGNSNTLQGNFIGTDSTGSVALPNRSLGLGLDAGLVILGSDNTIGGTTAQERNVISGNADSDILFNGGQASLGAAPTGNVIEGNYIGTNAKGNAILDPNGITIVAVFSEGNAYGNTIGGTAAGAGNVIAGATTAAIEIDNQVDINFGKPPIGENTIAGNLINTDRTGTVKLYSGGIGIELFDTTANTIGGTAASANVIAVGPSEGILIHGPSSSINQPADNQVLGNLIGIARDGKTDLGNSSAGIGVELTDTTGNTVDDDTFGFLDLGIDGISNNNDSGDGFIHVKTNTR